MDLKLPSLYLVLGLLALSYGSKESFQDLDQLLNDPNIWQYIEKRVSNKEKAGGEVNDEQEQTPIDHAKNPLSPEKDQYHEPTPVPPFKETPKYEKPPVKSNIPFDSIRYGIKTLSDSSGNSCSYRQKFSMIIRSKTSLNNDAVFLKSLLGVKAEDCAEKCCYTQNCNLAVYEDKEDHNCYLFDCGNPSKCSFAHHGNYTVMSFNNHNYEPHQHQQYHENELESLGKTSTPKPTTAAPTTKAPKYETPAPIPPRIKVPLFGDCDMVNHCGNRNAICDNGQCLCKKGYHPVEAYCREICSKDEFQCVNKGKDNTVPDCIDIKYKCDGVPQCADDSDEDDCPSKTADSKESEDHKEPKIPIDDKESDELEQEDKPTPKPQRPIVPQHDKSKETDEQSSNEEGNEENENSDKKGQEANGKQDSVTKSTTSEAKTPKVPKTTTVTTNLEGPQKVKVISPTDSNQGPIVALALGLGICLMLLIFVGCRLRTVKRRLRRGKSLHSNEADYLINGMYL